MVDGPITDLNSRGLYLPLSSGNTNQLFLHCLYGIQLRRYSSGKVATSTFTAPYAHTAAHYSTSSKSPNWVVDLGASHHVTADLAALALHKPYTASDSAIIGDGTSLTITNISSFTFPFLPTPLFFTNVLYVSTMSKNLISVSALYDHNLVNVLFFYSFFQVDDRHKGVTLVRGQCRDDVYYWLITIPPSIFRFSSDFFISILVFCYLHVA